MLGCVELETCWLLLPKEQVLTVCSKCCENKCAHHLEQELDCCRGIQVHGRNLHQTDWEA